MTTRYLTDAKGNRMSVVDVGGFLMPHGRPGTSPEQCKRNFENIRDFRCRDNDILLLSYPKTGTTWLHEIITRLIDESTERPVKSKGETMLEIQTQDKVDTICSPRCLNTHVQYKYLPKELQEKQLRTILVVRNPKDALVSHCNQIKGMRSFGYNGEFKDWFQLYMQAEMVYGMYADYLNAFEKAMTEGICFPLHLLQYENLKLNGLEEVMNLAKFLGLERDKEFCQNVVDKCSFDNMKNRTRLRTDQVKLMFNDSFTFFRKGQIGDWKNWFTVAQNEQFDKYWEKEMADSKIKFTYT